MTDDPLDLSPLDPRANTLRYEAAIGALMVAAAPELRARQSRRTVRAIDEMSRWWRPTLAAAATIAAIALGDLVLTQRTEQGSTGDGWATIAGVPTQLATYVEGNQMPHGDQVIELTGAIR
jgi:hypothetical protein